MTSQDNLNVYQKNEIVGIQADDAVDFLSKATLADVESMEAKFVDFGLDISAKINEAGLTHLIYNNMYCRALFVEKGKFLTGKMHMNKYIDICAYGDVLVRNFFEDGTEEDETRLQGFSLMKGVVGRKRVVVAYEDTLWITVDPTNATNLEEAEEETLAYNSSEFISKRGML